MEDLPTGSASFSGATAPLDDRVGLPVSSRIAAWACRHLVVPEVAHLGRPQPNGERIEDRHHGCASHRCWLVTGGPSRGDRPQARMVHVPVGPLSRPAVSGWQAHRREQARKWRMVCGPSGGVLNAGKDPYRVVNVRIGRGVPQSDDRLIVVRVMKLRDPVDALQFAHHEPFKAGGHPPARTPQQSR